MRKRKGKREIEFFKICISDRSDQQLGANAGVTTMSHTPHPHKISYSILPLAQQTSSILKDETIALMSKLLLSETITTYF